MMYNIGKMICIDRNNVFMYACLNYLCTMSRSLIVCL